MDRGRESNKMSLILANQPSLDTNAWRILHLVKEGIWVDNFDGRWWVQTQSNHYPKKLESLHGQATSIYWRPRDAKASEQAKYIAGAKIEDSFVVQENGVSFKIDFQAGYSPGIFLDQRVNRLRVKQRVKPNQKILNTFAYTGAFSVVAAMSDAKTTTLDLSLSLIHI